MKKKIKVLHITTNAKIGGGPEHIYLLVNYMKKNENILNYICSPSKETYSNKFKNVSEKFLKISSSKLSLINFIKIFFYVYKYNIDILHTHGKSAGIYRVVRLLKRNLISIHTIHEFHYKKNKNIFQKMSFYFEKYLNTLSKKIICVSNGEEKDVIKQRFSNKNKIVVIPNGIEIGSDEFSIDLGLKKYFVIGTIARLSPEKGIIRLVKAFKNIKKIKNKKLLIIGDGIEKSKIEKYIKENDLENDVIMLGEKLNAKSYINNFDLYVNSSEKEGLPITILEVMARYKLVVATNVVGNNEVIKNNITGKLCSVDVENIALKIEEAYSLEDSLKERILNSAYNLIKEKYNIRKMVDDISKIYREIS